MKKIFAFSFYQGFVLLAISIFVSACQEDELNMGKPVITEVRNYAATPNDTLVETINEGQWVVISGKNLSSVTGVLFCGVPATINNTLFTDEHMVVQIPAIVFPEIPVEERNTIRVFNKAGMATYSIDIIGLPLITHVRNFASTPNDTLITSVTPGQHINIVGYNLKDALTIAFQGISADLSDVVYTDTSAIIHVPANLAGGDASLADKISYTTRIGTGTFSIKIIGPPLILRISNENPVVGDSVFLYGKNLETTQSLTFAGVAVAEFTISNSGEKVGFLVSALSASAPASITTTGGEFTTAYNVNDVWTGAIGNLEWSDQFGWEWWGGANLECGNPSSGWPPYNATYVGNPSQYLTVNFNPLNGDEGADYSHAVRIGENQWMPVENLDDAPGSWGIKFEFFVSEDWNGATLVIAAAGGYKVRYEPWKVSPTSTKSFKTKGWQTVTIPLSSFRSGDGIGTAITSIKNILGETGKSNLIPYLHNYGSTPTTAFKAAFDNFRVVKL